MYENSGGGQTLAGAGSRPNQNFLKSSQETERVLLLDEISNRVQSTNEQFGRQIMELRELIDGMIGGNPSSETGKVANTPRPGGRAYGLSQETSMTLDLVGVLREQIDRLRDL